MVRSPGRSGPPRVGLVVSRDVRQAVRRNRIKRRLRHAVRALQLEPNMDYVIIANPQIEDAPFSELLAWLNGALEGLSR